MAPTSSLGWSTEDPREQMDDHHETIVVLGPDGPAVATVITYMGARDEPPWVILEVPNHGRLTADQPWPGYPWIRFPSNDKIRCVRMTNGTRT